MSDIEASTRQKILGALVPVWWCEVCNVKCDTKEVLDKYKMGKKHKKEEKLKDSTTPPPPATSRLCVNPGIEPEELELKRRKLMKEGADPDAVMMCEICNVVCNS
ncbi:hypothetical protein Vadar_009674 [Vaccinium darrowii]|uniref:Uncharacterized protein n=1 Tax=Vaccinium darrowii TaxID=229202 RepID=A0ACB7ZJM1_9ERIC|nr:hypothetical protein Vadar_009674 [Vaccinium darrowii]